MIKKLLTVAILLGVVISLAPRPSAAQSERPSRLPFDGPPGPNSWFLSQPYGNTTNAYRYRASTYQHGQGIHFGVDLSAPCGTPVVAIGDGFILHVDGPHGSPPHNVVIQHPNGYSSLYGHLLERSTLTVGDSIKAGEMVGLSGDSRETCYSSPHLHLEIRSHSRTELYNPMTLIDADWDSIALFGSTPRSFQRDLNNPRRWQYLEDQPNSHLQGLFLNDYQETWPLGRRSR